MHAHLPDVPYICKTPWCTTILCTHTPSTYVLL